VGQSRSIAFEPAHELQRRPVLLGQVQLYLDAGGQDLLELEAPFDDLIAPMVGRLRKPGILKLEQMFDYVPAK
jgi:hypothetical protein